MNTQPFTSPRRTPGVLTLLLLLFGVAAPARAFETPARFIAVGDGVFRVEGPGCCGGQTFSGSFRAAYEIDSWGQVTVESLTAELDPTTVTGVGLFGLGIVELACAVAGNQAPVVGWLWWDTLFLPTGSLTLNATTFESRSLDGECLSPKLGLEIVNTGPLLFLHRPYADEFKLSGAVFSAIIGGDLYTVRLDLTGHYANRPPVAGFGMVLPGFEQGGCPAILDGGNPPRWVIEANVSAGLKAPLRSFSYDPDGPLSRTDLDAELWSVSEDGGPWTLLGAGAELPHQLFALGHEYRVLLLAADRAGAVGAEECQFVVVPPF